MLGLLKGSLFLTIPPVLPFLKSLGLGSLPGFTILIFNLNAFNNFPCSARI